MSKLKIGIFGAGVRGLDLARNFLLLGCDIVAICETREERRELAKEKLGNAKSYSASSIFSAILLRRSYSQEASFG